MKDNKANCNKEAEGKDYNLELKDIPWLRVGLKFFLFYKNCMFIWKLHV